MLTLPDSIVAVLLPFATLFTNPTWQKAQLLLVLLLQHLDRGDGPLVFGIDETLERRRGPRIKARGIYRDAVRSSRHQTGVTASFGGRRGAFDCNWQKQVRCGRRET